MKIIYHVYACEGELGEVEGMFDSKGNLISCWCCDDATWRNEYFSGFMQYLGVEVKSRNPTSKDIKLLEKEFGLTNE